MEKLFLSLLLCIVLLSSCDTVNPPSKVDADSEEEEIELLKQEIAKLKEEGLLRDQEQKIRALRQSAKRKLIHILEGQKVLESFFVEDEEVIEEMVRFRTVGDMSCTAAVLSDAVSIDKVVEEIRDSTISERGARIDDKRSEAAMEKRKQQGYF